MVSIEISLEVRRREIVKYEGITSKQIDLTLSFNLCRIICQFFMFSLDDFLGPVDDLSNVAIEDDAFDELQAVVNKTMKLKAKKDNNSAEKV